MTVVRNVWTLLAVGELSTEVLPVVEAMTSVHFSFFFRDKSDN
jgi:hypothetical protein